VSEYPFVPLTASARVLRVGTGYL